MDKTIDNLIAESQKSNITINGREYVIGKFNIITYFRIAKFIAKVGKKYASKFTHIASSKTDIADIIQFMEILDENDLIEAISIALNESDLEFCKQIDGDSVLLLVETVCKHNDFGVTVKNAQRVVAQLKNQTPVATIG
jgi:hypothetical protein